MTTVITAQNLYKCYPGFPPVLRGVNIDVKAGEMVAVMGPSGCGKSTMLHILGMLHAPDSGSLNILNTDITTLDRDQTSSFRRGNMGFVMQSSNLFEHSTVFENVEFPLIYEQIPPEERWERVIRALELVRLSHRVSYRSNRLSGGEQQRVAVARAMVNNPRILLADEPTGALDARTSKVVMQNFRSLAHDGGIAMVIVTHDPSVAEYCDSVYTLEEGILHCKKHEPVPAPSGNIQILQSIPRKLNAVCVVDQFPTQYGTVDVQSILNLHEQRMLSRVYSMRGTKISSIGEGEYSLPVPIKKQGRVKTLFNIISLLRTSHNNPGIVWKYWSEIPASQRLNLLAAARHFWHMAKGIRMVTWSITDETAHLHALGSSNATTAAWITAGILGIPFSFSMHTRQLKSLSFLAVKAKYAKFVCCDTKQTQQALQQACLELDQNFPIDKILNIYDSPNIYPSLEDTETINNETDRQGEINILMSGHISAKKGILDVLQACQKLKKDKIPISLTVVGGGLMMRFLRMRARIMGLRKQVTFTGYMPNDQMSDFFRKAHVFVAAGKKNENNDGIPTSLMEAMLFGLPIIASDLKGHLEILEHDKNALIFENGNVESLKEALRKIVLLPEEATNIGRAAQETARELFSQENQGVHLGEAIMKHHSSREM